MLLQSRRPQYNQLPYSLALPQTHSEELVQDSPSPQFRARLFTQPQQNPQPSGPLAPDRSILRRLYQPSQSQKLTEPQKLRQLADIIEFEEIISKFPGPIQLQMDCFNREQIDGIFQARTNALYTLLDKLLHAQEKIMRGPQMQLHPFYMPKSSSIEIQAHLLQHFESHTSTSFNADPIERRYSDHILRETAVQYSFQSASLMNSVLALTALHIKRKRIAGDPALIALLAHEYVDTSASQLVADMDVADPNSFPHLVIASLLMTAISSEQFRDGRSGLKLYILHWMKVWCGISVMMDRITVAGLIETGLLKLFYRPLLNLEAGDENTPEVIRTLVAFDPADPNNHAIYREAARYLGTLYHHLKDGLSPMMILRIVTWVTFLPKEFVQLAFQRHWKALVIVAHYAVFLKLTTRIWWMENVGQRSIEDLIDFLGLWKLEYVQVPFAAMRTDEPIELGRLLLGDETWEHEPSTRIFTREEMLFIDEQENFENFFKEKERVTVPGSPGYVFHEAGSVKLRPLP